MIHLDLDDTKYHEDTNRQAAKEAEHVNKVAARETGSEKVSPQNVPPEVQQSVFLFRKLAFLWSTVVCNWSDTVLFQNL